MFTIEQVAVVSGTAEPDADPQQPSGDRAAPVTRPIGGRGSAHRCRACNVPDEHDQWNAGVRGETPVQRLDRAYGEILQELRVAQTGVQFLLAFLLSLAFTGRFASITHLQRDMYVATLALGAGAAALLIAPAAFHRMVYRQRLKRQLVRVANRLALAGLLLLLATMGSSLLLILDVVTGMRPAMVLTGGVMGWFVALWFVLPVWTRIRHRSCRQLSHTGHGVSGASPLPR